MKRILIALFMIFVCGQTFAAGPIVSQAPIFVFADVLEYAIKKNFSVMDYDAVTQEWEKRMSADGTVTATDIEVVCKIGRLDKNACTKFRDDLMTYFYPICEKSATKGKSNCVDDFWATIHGTWVRLSEAIGIAQEYAQLKNKETVVCSPKTRQVNPPARASYLKCTSVDGGHYYEFKFNSTTETNDRDIISGTLRAVGKMHNIEFQNSDCTLERIASDSSCALAYKTSDIGQCEKINKSLKRFGYSSKIITTEKFGKRCEVFGITGGNRSAYGIDNTVFQDVQYVAGPEVENRIKAYVQKELSQQNIKLEKFSCDKTTKHDYTNVALDGLIKEHNEILTCYVNGSPIDFLFADLSESGKRAKEAGLSKMACAQIGGKIDGRDCRGLDEMECAKVSHKIPGGTTWDEKAKVCILNNPDIEKRVNDRIQILGGLVLAVGIAVAIVPGLALSATGETAYILLSGVGSVIFDQGFIQIEELERLKPAKYAYEFVTDAIACDIPAGTTQCNRTEVACAIGVVSKHFGHLDEIIDKLNDSQLTSVVEAMVNVTDCLSDEQFRNALKTITISTNLKDKIINQAGLFWLITGLFVSPENTITKLASRAPKIAKVLRRCTVLERISGSLNGAKYTRIFVDNLDANDIKKLVNQFEKRGIHVSSNMTEVDNRRFIGVADLDVFGNWRNSATNWLITDEIIAKYNGQLHRGNKNIQSDYYRFYVNPDADNSQLLDELNSHGFYISSNTTNNSYFIAASYKNIFKPWEEDTNNWLEYGVKAVKQRLINLGFRETSNDVLISDKYEIFTYDKFNMISGKKAITMGIDGTADGRHIVVAISEYDAKKWGLRWSDISNDFVIAVPENAANLSRLGDFISQRKQLTSIRGNPVYITEFGALSGRPIVMVEVKGRQIPFYISTGFGGKTTTPTGKWEAFFGIGPTDGYFNKGSSLKEIEHHYWSRELQQIAYALDSQIGDLRNTKCFLHSSGRAEYGGQGFVGTIEGAPDISLNIINRDFNYAPGSYGSSTARQNITEIKEWLRSL